MYSKEEASQIRKKFWISFGQYMKLQPTASGFPVNWVNYKTGIKGLNFKTDAANRDALIRIEMNSPDIDIQHLMFEQFEEFKPLFEATAGDDWHWLKDVFDEHGRSVCRIEKSIGNISIFNEPDWAKIINFLKEGLIGLDEFWEDARHAFDIFK